MIRASTTPGSRLYLTAEQRVAFLAVARTKGFGTARSARLCAIRAAARRSSWNTMRFALAPIHQFPMTVIRVSQLHPFPSVGQWMSSESRETSMPTIAKCAKDLALSSL